MKKLTVVQLEELLQDYDQWNYSTELSGSDLESHDIRTGEEDEATVFDSWASGNVTVVNAKEELSINFSWVANGGSASYADAYDFTVSIDTNAMIGITGFELVDEDGEPSSNPQVELNDLMSSRAWEGDVKALLPVAKIEELDVSVEGETFEVVRDKAANLKFNGVLVASVASSDNNASGSSYSGSVGRWTVLSLYKTHGGKFICSKIGRTRCAGERDRFSAEVCDTKEQVVAFFGHDWLAKDLYAEAVWDTSVLVA